MENSAKRLVSADPGCYGALTLFVGGTPVEIADMPIVKVRRGKSDKAEVDGHGLRALLWRWQPDIGIVEQVGGMTGQSASAAFNFGRAAGAVEYLLIGAGARLERVPPGRWKRALNIKPGKDDSRLAAMRLWPALADKFARKKDDGRAESALIGHWLLTQIGDLQRLVTAEEMAG